MRSEKGWNCRDCLHTPKGACARHSIEGTELVTQEPSYIFRYKRRLWDERTEALLLENSNELGKRNQGRDQ